MGLRGDGSLGNVEGPPVGSGRCCDFRLGGGSAAKRKLGPELVADEEKAHVALVKAAKGRDPEARKRFKVYETLNREAVARALVDTCWVFT